MKQGKPAQKENYLVLSAEAEQWSQSTIEMQQDTYAAVGLANMVVSNMGLQHRVGRGNMFFWGGMFFYLFSWTGKGGGRARWCQVMEQKFATEPRHCKTAT